jgi:hypothetical protein
LLIGCAAPLAAQPACDEYNPFGPAYGAQIRLGPGDLVDEHGTELRSFVATDSVGKVDFGIVASSPPGAVLGVSAVPEISMFSPHHGERLKGINIAVSLTETRRPVSVVLHLSQVCAKHFRNTFLYY